jgi:hypothetical protein
MSSQFNGQNIVAQGRWAGAASSSTKGCTITQANTGNYIVTLEQGLGANECIIHVTPETAVGPRYSHTNNTSKLITLGDPTNLSNTANGNFNVTVFQLPGT